MTPLEQRGRTVLLTYFAVILFVSVTVIASYVSTRGLDELWVRIVRFALTVLLLIGLYRGSNLIRAILLFSFGLGGSMALLALLRADTVLQFVTFGSMAVIYLSFVAILSISPAVDAFLRYQRLPTLTDDV